MTTSQRQAMQKWLDQAGKKHSSVEIKEAWQAKAWKKGLMSDKPGRMHVIVCLNGDQTIHLVIGMRGKIDLL